jgi:hypothetical protein
VNATDQISSDYRELIEGSNLDWKVAQYVNLIAKACDHSFNEVKAAAIREIGITQHGQEEFDTACDRY